MVRGHVYHPGFKGSFSIKYVLNPLVPDLTYNDLVIVDGLVASVEIARLLFVAHKIPVEEQDRLRATAGVLRARYVGDGEADGEAEGVGGQWSEPASP